MREDPVGKEVVGALDLDVVDRLGWQWFNRGDLFKERLARWAYNGNEVTGSQLAHPHPSPIANAKCHGCWVCGIINMARLPKPSGRGDGGKMRRVMINNDIVADPQICHGKPTFKGTRIMVWQVLEMLEAGCSVAEIREAFPSLHAHHIKAALAYAADLTRGEGYVLLKR